MLRQILLFLIVLLPSALYAGSDLPALIPKPVKLQVNKGVFELDSKTTIVAGTGAEAEAQVLAEYLRKPTGFKLPVSMGAPRKHSIALVLDGSIRAVDLNWEGYFLSVTPNGVLIRAATPAGLFYGGQTLRQLLPPQICSTQPEGTTQPDRWLIPAVEIEDYPHFRWRGLLLDVARHYSPPEFVKRLVHLLALHKMNSLHLHLTDDQGWRIEIKKYPRLTQVGSLRKESPKKRNMNVGDGEPYGPFFYTQEQMRDIVEYARERHVSIVPEIEMPGHSLAALAAYPELSCTGGPFEVATRWGIQPNIFCAGNDQTLAFVRDVLGEIIEIFPGAAIHIGGDEAPKDLWKQCPKCQARIKAEGLKNEEQLQGWFNMRVEKFLHENGRKLVGWDEIVEGGLPPRAMVMSWRGMEGGIAAARTDHDVIMSPISHCYFDFAQTKSPEEPESIACCVPLMKVYEFEPVPQKLHPDKQGHIIGVQGNIWTECIRTPEDVEFFAFPRTAALAEVAWSSSEKRDFNEFRGRLVVDLKRLDELKVHYCKLDPP